MELPELPLWIIALVIIATTAILIKVHRRMTRTVKVCVLIPPLCLAVTYAVFSFWHIPAEIQRFFGRYSLTAFFIWYAILLWLTRKQHAPAPSK